MIFQLQLAKLTLLLLGLQLALASQTTIIPNKWQGYEKLKVICSCESTGNPGNEPRQFNDDGSVLWGNDRKTGKPIKRDVGTCQININAHGTELKAMRLDVVNSEEDNIAYAKILYDRAGTSPWAPSSGCWDNVALNP